MASCLVRGIAHGVARARDDALPLPPGGGLIVLFRHICGDKAVLNAVDEQHRQGAAGQGVQGEQSRYPNPARSRV